MLIEEIFAPDGILANRLPAYEQRPGQLTMALAIQQALNAGDNPLAPTGHCLVVEAGTGIGKTLAYLIPAVLSGQKVVISTATKNLQDQILEKDIPFIRHHLTPDLKAICVKGRQNYCCLYRYHQFAATGQQHLFATPDTIQQLETWLADTTSGDRAELSWLADNSPLWPEISATASQCLGIHCPEFNACFVTRLRQRAAHSDLLIVNHHLFCSDLALRRFGHAESLPRYESVIFDEAHRLEQIAAQYFGTSFSHYQVIDLASDIDKLARNELAATQRDRTLQLLAGISAAAERLQQFFPPEPGRFALLDQIGDNPGWDDIVTGLDAQFDRLNDHLENLATLSDAWLGFQNRTADLKSKLALLTEHPDPAKVYWYERRKRTVTLSASPVEIADELQDFYGQTRAVIFTSATLATGNSFRYFLERHGLAPDTSALTLTPPYDYQANALTLVPDNRFPEPTHREYGPRVMDYIAQLVVAATGRTLVLFTSIAAMRRCRDHLQANIPFPLLTQGDAPRNQLLHRFKEDTHSVLLAVASFWEGVDIPGQALSCVIIDKLPFEVPSDPVLKARQDKIRQEGGNPFMDFQVPRAVLALRQGVGRLIRSGTDRGLIAILDVRLFTKVYGRVFRDSLPPAPVTRDLVEAKNFLQQL